MKKRLSALLMALSLVVGCTMNGTLKVAAEESASINPYVYDIQNCAASPFRVKVETAANGGGSNEAVLYGLSSTGNDVIVEAYGVDADTVTGSARYRRINLEDADYFDEFQAGKIRAIVKNGVTEKTKEQLQKEANRWLKANDKEEIWNLTGAEALSAVQYAIWCTANEESIVSSAPYCLYEINPAAKHYVTRLGDPITFNQEIQYTADEDDATNISKQNIYGVAEYLLSLDAEALNEVAVSEDTIQNAAVNFKLIDGENGAADTYTAEIAFDFVATVNADTALNATVSVGENHVSQPITAAGPQILTLPGLTSKTDILITVEGSQKVSDVFLFEAEGGRTGSQSLVGVDSRLIPVHAEKVIATDRVINFTKTSSTDGETGNAVHYPLEGIVFDIYYACTINEYNINYETYKKPEIGNKQLLGTVTTDGLGKATFNATQAGGKDGVYLIVERPHLGVKKPLDPFYIALPMTASDGNGLITTVNLKPKNDVVEGPKILKDVTAIDNNRDSFDVNEAHTWILRGKIPVDLADGKSYMISDTLDPRLTYMDGLTVKVAGATAAAHTEDADHVLTEGVDYNVAVYDVNAVPNADVSGGDALTTKKITVNLTDAGMDRVATLVGADYANQEVRVYFNTAINNLAAAGKDIPNQAILEYTSSVNYDYEAKSDIPTVYTCGIKVYKHAAKDENKPLQYATFKVARKATAEESANENIEKEMLMISKGVVEEVVYVEFYDNPELAGSKVNAVTTNEAGYAMIYGLKELTEADPDNEEGDDDGIKTAAYYLVEKKAPSGYNLLKFPMEIKLNEESHLYGNRVFVANSNAFLLPETGGIGTTIFTLVGAALVIGSGIILVCKKRKKN